jgi:hypothetical protein
MLVFTNVEPLEIQAFSAWSLDHPPHLIWTVSGFAVSFWLEFDPLISAR